MRLSFAASIVASSAPLSLGVEGGRKLLLRSEDRKYRLRTLLQLNAKDRPKFVTGFRKESRGFFGRHEDSEDSESPLRNPTVSNGPEELGVEPKLCDPHSTDPDVGILSCGDGGSCMSDEDSVLGGVCLHDADDANHQAASRHLKRNGRQGKFSLHCDPQSSYYKQSCHCGAWNATSGTGNIVCDVYSSYCFDKYCPNVCTSLKIIYDRATAATYDFSMGYCYNFTSPYKQHFCYYFDYKNSTCDIHLNGNTCSSCTVGSQISNVASGNGESFAQTSQCTTFDCSNADPSVSGNSCYSYVSPPILFYKCNVTSTPSASPPTRMPTVSPVATTFTGNTIATTPTGSPVATTFTGSPVATTPTGSPVATTFTGNPVATTSTPMMQPSKSPTLKPAMVSNSGTSAPQTTTSSPSTTPIVCNVCGTGGIMTQPGTIVNSTNTTLMPSGTCADLQVYAVKSVSDGTHCQLISKAVFDVCGCTQASQSPTRAPSVPSGTDTPSALQTNLSTSSPPTSTNSSEASPSGLPGNLAQSQKSAASDRNRATVNATMLCLLLVVVRFII